MNFAKPNNKKTTSNAHNSLYPGRVLDDLSQKVFKLSQFEKGIEKPLELTDEEKAEFFVFEETLGEELEVIFDIPTKTIDLYPDYLSSIEGSKDFEGITGINPDNQDVWQIVLSEEVAKALSAIDFNTRSDFVGRSRKWVKKQLFNSLVATRDSEGNINHVGIEPYDEIRIFLGPENTLRKIRALHNFQDKLQDKYQNLDSKSDNMQEALSGILNIYRRRVQLLLLGIARGVVSLRRKEDLVGINSLTAPEVKILQEIQLGEDIDLALSRYDKMIWGASDEHDDLRSHPQINRDLSYFVDKYEKQYFANLISKNREIEAKGLDPQKLQVKNLTSDDAKQYAEEILQAYNLLKNPNSKESHGWHFDASEIYQNRSVNPHTKTVKWPVKMQSIEELIAKLAHEVEGHVLQNYNKSKLPIKILEKIGVGGSDVLAECGAMNIQSEVAYRAFGFKILPRPNYIRAMERRLSGGTYLDCLAVFYQNSVYALRLRLEAGDINSEEFETLCNDELEMSIGLTRRLFPVGSSLQKGSTLADSKNAAYLEQILLYRELKKYGLEKYIFITGMTLDALLFFMKIGIVNSKDIDQPKNHTLKIWERVRSKYLK